MADPRINAVTGFQQGLSSTLALLDRVDQRRRRTVLDQREDELFKEQQADRALQRERGETLFEQQQQDRELTLEDNAYTRERQRVEDERADQMAPLERQLKEAQVAGAISRDNYNRAQMRIANQKQKASEAQAIAAQAITLARSGDIEGSMQAWSGLEEYGYDVEALSKGSKKMRGTVEKLVNGDLSIESDEFRDLAKVVLMPSFVQSGRDPNLYEIGTLTKTDKNTFAVTLIDKQTGRPVPATLGASSDVEGDPVVTEISVEDLMAAGQNMMALADEVSLTRMNAMGSRLGLAAPTTMSDLERRQKEADIEKTLAQADKEFALADKARRPADGGSGNAFSRLFESDVRPGEVELSAYMSEQGLSELEQVHALSEVRKLQSELPDNKPLVEVYELHYKAQEDVKRADRAALEKELSVAPNIDQDKVMELIQKYRLGDITRERYNEKIKQLKSKAEQQERIARQTPSPTGDGFSVIVQPQQAEEP